MTDTADLLKRKADLQKEYDSIVVPELYTKAEQDQIMRGRYSQPDIDAGRATINARVIERGKAQDRRRAILDEIGRIDSQISAQSPYEQFRQIGINAVPAGLGYLLGHSSANALDKRLDARALYRAQQASALASQLENLSPEAISKTAKSLGLLSGGRGAWPPYLVPAAFIAMGLGTRAAAPQISNETGQESARGLGSAEIGFGAGMLGQKIFQDTSAVPAADAVAMAKIHDAILGGGNLNAVPENVVLAGPTADAVKEGMDRRPAGAHGRVQPLSETATVPEGAPQQALPRSNAEPQPVSPAQEAVAAEEAQSLRGLRNYELPRVAADHWGIKLKSGTKAGQFEELRDHLPKVANDKLYSFAKQLPDIDATMSPGKLRMALDDFFAKAAASRGRVRLPVPVGVLGPALGGYAVYDAITNPAEAGVRRDETPLEARERQAGNVLYSLGLHPRAWWDTGTALADLTNAAIDSLSAPESVVPKPEAPDKLAGILDYRLPDYADPRSPKYNPQRIREEEYSRREIERIRANIRAETERQRYQPIYYKPAHLENYPDPADARRNQLRSYVEAQGTAPGAEPRNALSDLYADIDAQPR